MDALHPNDGLPITDGWAAQRIARALGDERK